MVHKLSQSEYAIVDEARRIAGAYRMMKKLQHAEKLAAVENQCADLLAQMIIKNEIQAQALDVHGNMLDAVYLKISQYLSPIGQRGQIFLL